MVAGSRSASSNRQSGRYSEDKDRRSNRKTNRKNKKDQIDIEQEVRDVVHGELSTTHDFPLPVKNNIIPSVIKELTEDNHDKVVADRPDPKPSWHLQQQAITPSKSYVKQKSE
jgi:hypothetical protein